MKEVTLPDRRLAVAKIRSELARVIEISIIEIAVNSISMFVWLKVRIGELISYNKGEIIKALKEIDVKASSEKLTKKGVKLRYFSIIFCILLFTLEESALFEYG